MKHIKFCKQNTAILIVLRENQVFIDPTFFGIFVCGPLQSFVVNVCTIKKTYIMDLPNVAVTNVH